MINCEDNIMYISTNKERCVIMGTYLIENNATVRLVASKFGISKSTVHKDITENLKEINPILYKQVQEVLTINKNERHLRGGEATRIKYLQKHNNNQTN